MFWSVSEKQTDLEFDQRALNIAEDECHCADEGSLPSLMGLLFVLFTSL